MKSRIGVITLLAVMAAAPASAQVWGSNIMESILQAARLPAATQEARDLGIPESDIQAILRAARQRQISPAWVTDVFRDGNQSIREHGPIDNFGAFVQSRLDQGLRGRDLAAAIRAEHAARGIGKGHRIGPDGKHVPVNAPGQGRGKSGDPGKPDDPGKSGDAKDRKGGGR